MLLRRLMLHKISRSNLIKRGIRHPNFISQSEMVLYNQNSSLRLLNKSQWPYQQISLPNQNRNRNYFRQKHNKVLMKPIYQGISKCLTGLILNSVLLMQVQVSQVFNLLIYTSILGSLLRIRFWKRIRKRRPLNVTDNQFQSQVTQSMWNRMWMTL